MYCSIVLYCNFVYNSVLYCMILLKIQYIYCSIIIPSCIYDREIVCVWYCVICFQCKNMIKYWTMSYFFFHCNFFEFFFVIIIIGNKIYKITIVKFWRNITCYCNEIYGNFKYLKSYNLKFWYWNIIEWRFSAGPAWL